MHIIRSTELPTKHLCFFFGKDNLYERCLMATFIKTIFAFQKHEGQENKRNKSDGCYSNGKLQHTSGPGNRSRFLVKLQLVNPVRATRTMIEGDNSCLGKIRKDMDKIQIRSHALNTQTKYLTGAYYLKYQHITRISMWENNCAANSAFQHMAQFANILWSQVGGTLPGRIIGLLSFSLPCHIWPRGQFYNTNQNISRKQVWFLSFPSLIIVLPCRSPTLSDTEGSSFVISDPCIWAMPFFRGHIFSDELPSSNGTCFFYKKMVK